MYEKNYVGQTAAAGQAMVGGFNSAQTAPPPPTLFSGFAGQLEARVAHMHGLIDRAARVADRLIGSQPEEANPGKIRGQGACVASQIENSMEDLDSVTRHAERTIERLERL